MVNCLLPARHCTATHTAGKMKALSKEVRGFTGRTRLPIYAASAICVRYDAGEQGTAVQWCVHDCRRVPDGLPGTPFSTRSTSRPALPCPCPAPAPAPAPPPAERMDKMRALITGPEGTPYYGGAFIFDAFFPDDYPAVPPLMELETTGGGVARVRVVAWRRWCVAWVVG